jgi:cytochrome c biogenesis protein CcdA
LAADDHWAGAAGRFKRTFSEVQALGTQGKLKRSEPIMLVAGIFVTLLGFVISLLSLSVASGVNTRLLIVVLGIAVSLFGILGMINPAYLKNAIWRKQS